MLSAQTQSSAERKQRLKQELARYVRILTTRGNPERVIVFGSLATGHVHTWSDIDLVIIEQTDLPFLERLHRMRDLLQPQVGTDFLVYTPQEFEQLCQTHSFFCTEIMTKGIVVYERTG